MTADILKQAGLFLLFIVAQVIFLGRIHLFNVATPLLYVYFVTMFPRNYPKWALLLWGFAMGLLIDTFFNTPGLASASMTLVAAVQPYILELFVPRDSAEGLIPSLQTLGPSKYVAYQVILVLLYCLVFYTLEIFNLSDLLNWALCIVGSAAVTLMLIFTFEIARGSQQ